MLVFVGLHGFVRGVNDGCCDGILIFPLSSVADFFSVIFRNNSTASSVVALSLDSYLGFFIFPLIYFLAEGIVIFYLRGGGEKGKRLFGNFAILPRSCSKILGPPPPRLEMKVL